MPYYFVEDKWLKAYITLDEIRENSKAGKLFQEAKGILLASADEALNHSPISETKENSLKVKAIIKSVRDKIYLLR